MRTMILLGGYFALALGLLGLRIHYLHKALARAETEKAEINRAYQSLAEQYQAADDAYQALIAAQVQVRERHQPAVRRAQSAKTTDDAPLAPVLRQALEDLQP